MTTVNVDGKDKGLPDVNTEIKEALGKQPLVTVGNVSRVHGVASGLKKGKVVVKGDVNDYVGTVNSGAELVIEGNAGNFLGDNMTAGRITVEGSTGYGAGMYLYGGTLYVRGDAGDFTGTMNKGATVVIGGSVGNEVATYMTAGELVVLGDAGENLGNFIIRGTIYLLGDAKSLGNNVKEDVPTKEELKALGALFKELAIGADPAALKKYVPASEKPFYKQKTSVFEEVCACQ